MIRENELKGRHKGKLGFVLGAGPSLRFVDPQTLAPYVTVAVNSSISKFRNAKYFLAQDIGVTKWDYFHDIPPDCICLLNRGRLRSYCSHIKADNVCLFNKDLQRTSAGSAVHFLQLMGCDPIVLLGCDCDSEGLKHYFWEYEEEQRCKRLDREHKSDAKQKDNLEFLSYWDGFAAKLKALETKLTVIDASGGAIKAFMSMPLEEVLQRFGERK